MIRNSEDMDAIRRTIENYYDGMALNSESKLRQAFHPHACIIGNYQGELDWASLDTFIAVVKNDVPDNASKQDKNYHIDINTIDITNDSAVARVTNNYVGEWYTDYLSLLKHNDRWVIINKLFHHYADHGRQDTTS